MNFLHGLPITYPSVFFYLVLLAWGTGLVLGSVLLGRRMLSGLGFRFGEVWSESMASLGLGLAVLSYLVFGAAAFQALNPVLLWGLTVLWCGAGWVWCALKWRQMQALTPTIPQGVWGFGLLAILLLLAAFNALTALTPAVDWDGLAYHLALPKIYLQHGGFVFRPDIFHNLFPQFTEMLFLLGLWAPFGVGAKAIHFGFGLFTAGVLVALGRSRGWRNAAWLGALIFYVQYIVHIESGTAFVDLAGSAYTALAMLALFRVQSPARDARWLYLGLFFLGINAATKWQGAVLLAAVVAVVWIWLFWAREGHWTVSFKQGLAGSVASGIPVLPYMAKAWILGGNPFWPLAYSWFGGRGWDAAIAERVVSHHNHFGGVTKAWWGLLRLPYDLIVHGSRFGHGGHELRWPLLGGLLLLAAWLMDQQRRRTDVPVQAVSLKRGLFIAVLAYVVVWFKWLPEETRYLLPFFPLAAWASAGGLLAWWRKNSLGPKVLAIVSGALLLAVHPPVHRDTMQQARVLLGKVPAEGYCAQKVEFYEACGFLNRAVQPGERVLIFGDNRGFYLDAAYLWGDPMLQKTVDYRALKTPEFLLARLKELGVHWVLYRTDLFNDNYQPPEVGALMREALQRAGALELAGNPVSVYRLKE